MIHDPNSVVTEIFRDRVKASQLAWPQKKEDVQAITFCLRPLKGWRKNLKQYRSSIILHQG